MDAISIDGLTFNFNQWPLQPFPHDHLNISPNSTHASLLMALLLGGVSIQNGIHSIIQDNNYLIIGAPKIRGSRTMNLERVFSELKEEKEGKEFFYPAKSLIVKYLKSQRSNHSLFSPLFNEIARAMLSQKMGRGLSAFVHIYRAVENLSYSFPLFYCRYQNEYMKAFNQLREFFKGGGELDFCNKFYQHLLEGEDFKGTTLTISYTGAHSAEFIDCLQKNIAWTTDKKHATQSIQLNTNGAAEIKIEDCFDLIIRIRNAFFHHLSGGNKSISSSQIPDADQFFLPINEIGLQVIGFLYSKLIKTHL